MTFSALDSVLVGSLFATEAMRTCFSDEARLRAMLQAEAALARAEAGLGLAPAELALALESIPAESLDASAIGRATALAGVPTIPFIKAIQARLPPDLEPHFHKGATTQDILDTALVLQCREALALIAADADAVLQQLSALATKHRSTPCVGRTYGQHAAPVSFGFKAAVWLSGIAEAAMRLPQIRSTMLVASLGGPVGSLASLGAHGPAVLDAFARELGLGTVSLAWHARRGRVAATGGWLGQLIGACAKMATDVAQLASTEVAEVAEPYLPGRGGSSAMPHKRNPVSCTVILAAHAAAPGHVAALLGAMAAGHERPAGLWHTEWHALPTLFGLAAGAARETSVLASGLEVDARRMLRNLDATRGLLFADAAAARLAPAMGREAAHALVEEAAAEVRRGDEPLQAVLHRAIAPSGPSVDLAPAFDLGPAVKVASDWIDRALQEAASARTLLSAAPT